MIFFLSNFFIIFSSVYVRVHKFCGQEMGGGGGVRGFCGKSGYTHRHLYMFINSSVKSIQKKNAHLHHNQITTIKMLKIRARSRLAIHKVHKPSLLFYNFFSSLKLLGKHFCLFVCK